MINAIFSSDLNLVIKTRSKLTLHPVAFPPTKLQTSNDDNNNNNDNSNDDDNNNNNNNNNNNDDDDDNNTIRNMESLKLGKEIEKDLLCSP